MPTAKPNTRLHATPPSVNHRMRLDLFVDTPYGPSDLCSIDAYLHHYAKGPQHSWTGQLKIGDEFAGPTHGFFPIDLPEPDRGGSPEKNARDIAVFLARKYFESLGVPDPRERVVQLWKERRVESLKVVAAKAAAAVVCVEKELPLKSVKAKETHKGITDASKVSQACKDAKKLLQATAAGVVSSKGAADGKGAYMIAFERSAYTERMPDKTVLHGPFWLWAFGDETAEYVKGDGSIDIHWPANASAA